MNLISNRKLDKWLGWALIAVLFPFTRLLGILLRRDHAANRPPEKILFIKLLGLGSLVVATNSVLQMKKQFPSSKFVLITDRNIAAGIEPFQVFDEIWSVNMNSFFSVVRGAVQFIFRSWKIKFLWVIDLEVYSKLTTVYSLITAAGNRFGFILPQSSFRRNLNTHNIVFDRTVPLDDNYAAMAAEVMNKSHVEEIPSVKREKESRRSYIILNNTCSELAPVRKLPDKTFSEICEWILTHTGYRIAIAGAVADRNGIEAFIQNNFVDHSGKARIRNIAGAFEFASYYQFLFDEGVCLVTIDSGPLHIARKLGLPTVSVWGPTDPAQYLKINGEEDGKRHLQIYLHVPCSPCVHVYEKLPCGGDNICMKNIETREITKKIETLLRHLEWIDLPEAVKSDSPAQIGEINDHSAIH